MNSKLSLSAFIATFVIGTAILVKANDSTGANWSGPEKTDTRLRGC